LPEDKGARCVRHFGDWSKEVRAKGERKSSTTLNQVGYSYDAASRLQSAFQSSAQGFQPVSATYQYVANSPLVGGIAFTNNGVGRLTTAKSYDLLDRLTAVSSLNSQPLTISASSYGYNNASLRTAITNEAGAYWVYQFSSTQGVFPSARASYWESYCVAKSTCGRQRLSRSMGLERFN
jgi:hypothetical protein